MAPTTRGGKEEKEKEVDKANTENSSGVEASGKPNAETKSEFQLIMERFDELDKRITAIEDNTSGLKKLESDVVELKTEQQNQKQLIDDHTDTLNSFTTDIEEVHENNVQLKKELDDQKKQLKSMASVVQRLDVERQRVQDEMRKAEDYSRCDCLIFEGITEEANENCTDKILGFIKDRLKIEGEIKLQRCHRLGTSKDKGRSIIAKFMLFQDRQDVLKKAILLKGSKQWIRTSHSDTTTNRRNALLPLLKYMKKEKKTKCALINDIIYAGDKKYTLENAKSLPYCQEAVTRSNGEVLAFSGQLSILSNFYQCPIKIGSTTYSCSEQIFQSNKAIHNGASHIAGAILNTTDPVAQKRLGGSMNLKDAEWQSKVTMEQAVKAKFQQNQKLMDYLKSTVPMMLVHANAHDNEWGIGLSINNKEVLNPTKYTGKNILGDILMKIRDSQ